MNLILLESTDFRDDRSVVLTGRRADHIRHILKVSVGDSLRVGVVDGLVGVGRVTGLGAGAVELATDLTEAPPAPLPVTLLLALPRPKVLRRLIQTITAFGVKRTALFGAFRVEKSYWDTPWLRAEDMDEQVRLGLEQAGDTLSPVFSIHRRFKPFIEDDLPALTGATRCLVAHPGAERFCPTRLREPVSLAVGPEGGFTAYEFQRLCEKGFEPVGLGPRILRTEQVVPALLGRLLA